MVARSLILAAAALTWLGGQATSHAQEVQEDDAEDQPTVALDPRLVEVRFTDGSRLKAMLADQVIEVETTHGRLKIPAEDVRAIEFAQRPTADEEKQIQQWIAALASVDPQARDAAADELLARPQLAYHAVQLAARDSGEVAEPAEKLLARFREEYSPAELAPRNLDVVETDDTKAAGKIVAPVIKLDTTQFGILEMKLADGRWLRSLALAASEEDDAEAEPKDVLPDPGNLKAYEGQIGKSFLFKVTGGPHGSLWGTGTYTTDSNLAAAAMHAGVLKLGESGIVQVKIIASPPSFAGSMQNGLTSSGYGVYGGAYEVSKPKGKRRG